MKIDARSWSTLSALFIGFLGGALFMAITSRPAVVHVTPPPTPVLAQPPHSVPAVDPTWILDSQAARLELGRTFVAPGQQVVVSATTAMALPRDAWIGIIPSHVPHGDESVNDQHDLSYQYLEGRQHAVFVFTAPDTPGSYDLRLHSTDAGGVELASVTFQVAGF